MPCLLLAAHQASECFCLSPVCDNKKETFESHNLTVMKFCRPFARLWWDETVPTVVTRAEPHNQVIIYPHIIRFSVLVYFHLLIFITIYVFVP